MRKYIENNAKYAAFMQCAVRMTRTYNTAMKGQISFEPRSADRIPRVLLVGTAALGTGSHRVLLCYWVALGEALGATGCYWVVICNV